MGTTVGSQIIELSQLAAPAQLHTSCRTFCLPLNAVKLQDVFSPWKT